MTANRLELRERLWRSTDRAQRAIASGAAMGPDGRGPRGQRSSLRAVRHALRNLGERQT